MAFFGYILISSADEKAKSGIRSMNVYFRLLRPHQYIKNGFVFMPLFFSQNMDKMDMVYRTSISFICFCMVASAIYIFNDYMDIEDDQKHPQKRFRPLASGQAHKKIAMLIGYCLACSGLALAVWNAVSTTVPLVLYILINIGYSLRLKNIAILDVIIVALGFVCRLFTGAYAAGLPLSHWIVIMTFLLALFLALAKRRDDVLIYMSTGEKMRLVIAGYNLQFVDAAMTLMSGIVIVSYIMYCTSENVILRVGNDNVYLTALFVVIGIMRYMQIAFVEKNSGNPTRLILKDKILQMTISAWIITFIVLLYW